MSDKEKAVQLKEEELEKVSGGLPDRVGAADTLRGGAKELLETLNETNKELPGEVIL